MSKVFKKAENETTVSFLPDYTPEQLKEMGVYKEVYGSKDAPRLASLPAWPEHWYNEADPHGWLQWYNRYSGGRRIEDDKRQIKRWIAFKARHGGKAFKDNPTPRRAFALRNWGIDASKLVDDPETLKTVMDEYRTNKYNQKMEKVSFLPKSAKNEKPGLWANIRAKRKKGKPPAKPGDKAYPDKEQWGNLTRKEAEAPFSVFKPMPAYKPHVFKPYVNPVDKIKQRMGYKPPERFSPDSWKNGLNTLVQKSNDAWKDDPLAGIDGYKPPGAMFSRPTTEREDFFKQQGHDAYKNRQEILRMRDIKGLSKTYNRFGANIKEGRCWDGYEPVPGKKPYAPDSCRKKPKKKDKSKKADLSFLPKIAKSPAWQRSEGKNPKGGLNAKGRASYHRETGGTLKAPVKDTKAKGESGQRRKNFCSRMCGMKKRLTSAETARDPDSRINKSLRAWSCRCASIEDKKASIIDLLKQAELAQPTPFNLTEEQIRSQGGVPEIANAYDAVGDVVKRVKNISYQLGEKAYDTLSDVLPKLKNRVSSYLSKKGEQNEINFLLKKGSIKETIGGFFKEEDKGIKEITGDFLRGDDKGLDWRWGLLGGNLASVPVGGGAQAYAHNTVFPRGSNATKEEEKVTNILKRFLKTKGVDVGDDVMYRGAPSFNVFNNFINLPKRFKNPAILAHEAGHAFGSKPQLWASIAGKQIGALSVLPSLLTPNEETSRNIALGGTAAMVPTLYSEVDASIRGANLLKKLKVPFSGRAKAFLGIPTYLAAASLPMLSHLTKKYFGGFEDNKRASVLPRAKSAIELNTSVPGETPEDLLKRILNDKINKEVFLENAAKHDWNISGVPAMIARTVARKAQQNPDPYLRSLRDKVSPSTILEVIKNNATAFDSVSAEPLNILNPVS